VNKTLMRFEFFEALVRLSNFKYKDTGVCQTTPEAFQMLINDCILANYDFPPWNEWRQRDLWVLEVNDTFHVNLD